jgi:crossover junction endodeoxyribonuclease RuvC
LKVVGLDPGATTGFGVVARARDGAVALLECGVVRTGADMDMAHRLRDLYEGIGDVVARHSPDVVAVEGIFYSRNARTALVLGHARGAILLAATMRGFPVAEYSPAEVKNAVVGSGRATKEQIQYMVQHLLSLRSAPRPADAADAIAVALCHCYASRLPSAAAGHAAARQP